jgi:hypothetical protein
LILITVATVFTATMFIAHVSRMEAFGKTSSVTESRWRREYEFKRGQTQTYIHNTAEDTWS